MTTLQVQPDKQELTALLIDANKAFTKGLREKRPHAELVEIYAQIQSIYAELRGSLLETAV